PVLGQRATQPAGLLSGGQQQMLALAQALTPDPRLLIIDELSLGLAPAVVEELLDVVAHLSGGGLTTVLVEQSVTVALHLARRAGRATGRDRRPDRAQRGGQDDAGRRPVGLRGARGGPRPLRRRRRDLPRSPAAGPGRPGPLFPGQPAVPRPHRGRESGCRLR